MNSNIEQLTQEDSDNLLITKTIPSKLFIGALSLVLGIGFIYGASFFPEESSVSWISPAMLSLGVIAIGLGIYQTFWGAKKKVFSKTGNIILQDIVYFPANDLPRLMYFIEGKDSNGLKQLKREENCGVQAIINYSKDRQYLDIQLFEYIAYTYQSVSVPYRFYDHEAENISRGLLLS